MNKPFKTPNGWRIDYRRARAGEKPFRVQRVFDTKAEAESFIRQLDERVQQAARSGMKMPDSITVGQALQSFWNNKEVAESNHEAYRNRVKKWQAHHFAQVKINDLTRAHIRAYIKERRAAGRQESTIRNEIQVIKSLYDWLETEHDVHIDNPAARIKIGTSKERTRRLTHEEHNRIIRAFDALAAAYKARTNDHLIEVALENNKQIKTLATPNLLYLSAAYQAAIECALRREKLFSLAWRDIDLQRRIITVRDQGSKNKETPATIPTSLKLTKILQQLSGPAQRIGAALDEKVFGTLSGERAYRFVKQVAGALEIPDLRWHDLRHEACSRLAELGFSTLQIQRISGHKSLQSLKRYVHIRDEVMLELLDNPPIIRAAS